MAINKKLVHFKKLETFLTELSNNNILDTSIVFIQDANMIWTHNNYYPCPYTKKYLDTEFALIDERFATLADGGLRSIEVSISTTLPTEENYLFWISPDDNILKYKNPNGEWLTLNMLKDPNDGKYYVRKNKLWVPFSMEETVNITLSSNLTNPDSNLNGATITITYEDGTTKTETWNGSIITMTIPKDTAYTVSVSNVEGYTKPADRSYIAGMGTSQNIEFIYNTTKVTVEASFNPTSTNSVTASIKIGNNTALSYTLPTTVLVPTGLSYTVTFNNAENYKTPDPITNIAEGASLVITGEYKGSSVTINVTSNLNEKLTTSATFTYGSKSKVLNFNETVTRLSVIIPYGSNYSIQFAEVEGYKTPTDITGTANADNVTENGLYQAELVTVNVSGQGNTPSGYTVTLKSGDTVLGTQTTATKNYKIPFDTQYTVSASNVTGFVTPANQTFTANENTRTVAVIYKVPEIIDLSMYDIHGVKLANRTTANCYVVSKPGTYKFPLVYGNAIKNGQVNSAAYTNVGGEFTADFDSYRNYPISSPYIETDLVGYSLGEAHLSVCDTDGIFADISVVDGTPCKFIQFTVKKVPHTGANGVISLGKVDSYKWHWHIWVWEDDLTPITITNASGNNYDILPYNLGSKWDEDSKQHIKNWFYLWGRPVPQICPSAYNSETRATNYGIDLVTIKEAAFAMDLIINYPAAFFKRSPYNPDTDYNYNCNWIENKYFYNWWDANCTSTGANDNKVVKTVYDPCPPGYCVGNGNVFSYFSKSNVVGSFQNGWKFKANSSDTTGIFFPASGNIYDEDGLLESVGTEGHAWSSALNDLDYAYNLSFSSGYVSYIAIYGPRALGYSVRPVKEL